MDNETLEPDRRRCLGGCDPVVAMFGYGSKSNGARRRKTAHPRAETGAAADAGADALRSNDDADRRRRKGEPIVDALPSSREASMDCVLPHPVRNALKIALLALRLPRLGRWNGRRYLAHLCVRRARSTSFPWGDEDERRRRGCVEKLPYMAGCKRDCRGTIDVDEGKIDSSAGARSGWGSEATTRLVLVRTTTSSTRGRPHGDDEGL